MNWLIIVCPTIVLLFIVGLFLHPLADDPLDLINLLGAVIRTELRPYGSHG